MILNCFNLNITNKISYHGVKMPWQVKTPHSNIAYNYERIQEMAPTNSVQQCTELYESQATTKSKFVLIADLAAGERT